MRRSSIIFTLAFLASCHRADDRPGDTGTSAETGTGMCEDNGIEDCPCIDGQLCVAGLLCIDGYCQPELGDESGTDGDDGKPPPDMPAGDGDGDGDGDGTCQGSCGGLSSDGECWCDPTCVSFGDCCADYEAACPGQCLVNDDCADHEVCSAGSFSCVPAYGHSYRVLVTKWCDYADVCWDVDECWADVYYVINQAGQSIFASSTKDDAQNCVGWSNEKVVTITDDQVFFVQFYDEDGIGSPDPTNYWCDKNGQNQCWVVTEDTLHEGSVSGCLPGAGTGCYEVEIRFTAE